MGGDMNNECAIEELVDALKIARNHFPADIDISEDEASDLAKIDALLARVAEAANLIEAQAAEIERLREELNASVGLPQSVNDLIEEQAAEIERLGRELNKAKYGELDFSWAMHHAELDATKAEIERLHLLLAEKALDERELRANIEAEERRSQQIKNADDIVCIFGEA